MAYSTPPTFVAANVLTAAQLNTYLRDNFKAIGDAWAAYTPTLSGWTLGNGTLVGKVRAVGKDYRGRIEYTVGSTDTKSGAPMFSLPATPNLTTGAPLGTAGLLDQSSGTRAFRFAFWSSANSALIMADQADVRLSPTVPWTWATSDQILIDFAFEAV